MDRRDLRLVVRLYALIGVAVVAICYGAYRANPILAIGCVVAAVAFAATGVAIARYQKRRVQRMVENVEAGADRFIRGD